MAIKVGTPNEQATSAVGTGSEVTGAISLSKVAETKTQFALENVRDRYKREILESGEVDQLTSLIDVSDMQTIVEFGKEPAAELSKVADNILKKYNNQAVANTNILVDKLISIMKKVDIDEIREVDKIAERRQKSFFGKLLGNAEDKLNALVTKYQNVSNDIEAVCAQLQVYEKQIKDSNDDIDDMYDAALQNYRTLTVYILAGEQAIKEIDDYAMELQRQYDEGGSSELDMQIRNVQQAKLLMEGRVADFRGAEAVALQSVPILKIQEYTNANLARKVNSSFIVTIPAFKTALVSAVITKQQALQAQGFRALDEMTSELIKKNADNSVKQLQLSQSLASSSAIKAEDIEYAWDKIITGIKEYKDMEKTYSDIRKQEAERIEAANRKYLAAVSGSLNK